MHEVLEELKNIGVIPVIKIDDAEKAVPLAKALAEGFIPCAEITFRTEQGEDAMRRISRDVPDILLGAGTVLTTDQVDRAAAAGAKFIVSPGFNPKVVARCQEKGLPVIPGCSSPSDIEKALEMGLAVVKFFPAEQSGGLEYIKAVAAPYPSMFFVPTGGINAGNIAKYIAYERILACGGSWMVNTDLINSGDFGKITALCKEALFSLFEFEMVHVGVHTGSGDEALKTAERFSALFGFRTRPGNSSVFSGDALEIMKVPCFGRNGHIAIATHSVGRARAFFERQGIEFNPESVKTDVKGNLTEIYFKEEIGGFALHLTRK